MGLVLARASIAICWRVSERKVAATEEAELMSWTRGEADRGSLTEYLGSTSRRTTNWTPFKPQLHRKMSPAFVLSLKLSSSHCLTWLIKIGAR